MPLATRILRVCFNNFALLAPCRLLIDDPFLTFDSDFVLPALTLFDSIDDAEREKIIKTLPYIMMMLTIPAILLCAGVTFEYTAKLESIYEKLPVAPCYLYACFFSSA